MESYAQIDTAYRVSQRQAVRAASLLLLVACMASACGGSSSGPSGATQSGTAQSSAATPSGGPLPSQLMGTWHQVGTSSSATLTLTGSTYEIATDVVDQRGDVVVNGGEIDFFNAQAPGVPSPQGTGRYQWSVGTGMLRFTSVNPDPNGTRSGLLSNQSYVGPNH